VSERPGRDAVLCAYVALWTEADLARRRALVETSLHEDCEILGRRYRFHGHAEVMAEVSRFLRDDPGYRPVVTSGFDAVGRWVRFTIAVLDPEGFEVNTGWDVIEMADDGRIARVLTFWGPLALPPPA